MALRNPLSYPSQQLAFLVAKTIEIQQIQQIVQSCIDNDLAPHTRVANYDKGALTLMVENSAWASRLRYAAPELLSKLRSQGHLYQLKHIKVIVSLHHDRERDHVNAIKPLNNLPENTITPIQSIQDDALQSALKRLMRTLSQDVK